MKFRFHTGSIKSAVKAGVLRFGNSFDSILVRLKVIFKGLRDTMSMTGFDSILVRLKVALPIFVSRVKVKVSIPYWFD